MDNEDKITPTFEASLRRDPEDGTVLLQATFKNEAEAQQALTRMREPEDTRHAPSAHRGNRATVYRADDGRWWVTSTRDETPLISIIALCEAMKLRAGLDPIAESSGAGAAVEHMVTVQDGGGAIAMLEQVLPFVNTETTECRGDKCREPWCISCFGDEHAEASAVEAAELYKKAHELLAKHKTTTPRGG